MSAITRWVLTSVGGLALGLFASLSTPACIIPDYCIVVNTTGSDWCVNVEDALMWPVGHPEQAQFVRDGDGGPPVGCHCLNDAEEDILQQGFPAQAHDEQVEDIEEAARFACANFVPPGFDHNCLDLDEVTGPTLTAPYYGDESTDCVGSCAYANEPPHGSCGPDPNPWECNENGSGETGDATTGFETGDEPGAILDRRIIP